MATFLGRFAFCLAIVLMLIISGIAVTAIPKPVRPPSPCCGASCQFPGACGHRGCTCQVKSGWKPVDSWEPFAKNPLYEVFGHEVDGVFLYTDSRLVSARPGSKVQVPSPSVGSKAP